LVSLAEARAFEEEVARDDFLGRDGPFEASQTRFLPIVEIKTDLDPRGDEGSISLSTTLDLNNGGWGFRERK